MELSAKSNGSILVSPSKGYLSSVAFLPRKLLPWHTRPPCRARGERTSALRPRERTLIPRPALTGVRALRVDTLATSARVLLTLINICKARYVLAEVRWPQL